MPKVRYVELTDPGRMRPNNEDRLGHYEPVQSEEEHARGWLFALADGLGGHQAGEVASRIAVESVLSGFRRSLPREPRVPMMSRLFRAANEAVYNAASKPGQHGMGTTLVACALQEDKAVIAHVGDSRCYLMRDRKLSPLTRDHRAGGSSNVLTRALGPDLFASADTSTHTLASGDLLLLCSDGLHGALTDARMLRVLSMENETLEDRGRALIDLANELDGSDNVSLQLIHVEGIERMGTYRGRPYRILG